MIQATLLDNIVRNLSVKAEKASSTEKSESELRVSHHSFDSKKKVSGKHRNVSQISRSNQSSVVIRQNKRRADYPLNMSLDGGHESISQDDNGSPSTKEEEEEDDDDEITDDKLDGAVPDHDKVKAFNMFVRLFVDENLDRNLPISKQPKEKVQAIVDSCTRQFPEFSHRARKKIRLYLKSCRKMKRTRDQAGLDENRSLMPQLTTPQAEQLLARACENESDNAKRMRLGLDPISQPMPVYSQANLIDVLASCSGSNTSQSLFPNMSGMNSTEIKSSSSSLGEKQLKTDYKPEQLASILQAVASQPVPVMISSPVTGTCSITANSMGHGLPQTPLLPQTYTSLNGSSMFRSPFQSNTSFSSSTPLLQQVVLQNGPPEPLKKPPMLSQKLNFAELSVVRQLIAGYRESAAFLLRSADELENMVQLQQKS